MKVILLSKSSTPQRTMALAMHSCYSERPISGQASWMKIDEAEAGRRLVEKCLKFGHWSVLEHAFYSFSVEGFPHAVMQQIRTHRHLSVQSQSQRYTSKRFIEWVKNNEDLLSEASIEEFDNLFYLREPGTYSDRFGNKIEWTEDRLGQARYKLMKQVANIVADYLIDKDMPFEMVRDLLPAGYRQNFVISGNVRAYLHLLDMRLPKDAQLETSLACEQIKTYLEKEVPQVMAYYNKSRAYKNKLAP